MRGDWSSERPALGGGCHQVDRRPDPGSGGLSVLPVGCSRPRPGAGRWPSCSRLETRTEEGAEAPTLPSLNKVPCPEPRRRQPAHQAVNSWGPRETGWFWFHFLWCLLSPLGWSTAVVCSVCDTTSPEQAGTVTVGNWL